MLRGKHQTLLDELTLAPRLGRGQNDATKYEFKSLNIQKLLASAHKLGSLDSVDEKIQLLKRLLAIPSSSINEHDVIGILAAETEDLVSSVVKVSDIYTAEKTKETLQLLTLTLKFFNRVLGIVITL